MAVVAILVQVDLVSAAVLSFFVSVVVVIVSVLFVVQ